MADPEIASFGSWAEQLIAESTGKHGVGIVPVDLEPLGRVDAYGPDRVFVRLTVADSAGPAPTADGTAADDLLTALEAAGHPVVRIALADPIDLAGEFVRWEVATAIAGIVLGIDPFDQPNVEEAKEGTRHALAAIDRAGRADGPPGDAPAPSRRSQAWRRPFGPSSTGSPSERLRLPPGLVAPTAERDAALSRIRAIARDRTRRATTAGYGPRFLHSTGQLHKGGPPIGWFLQLTADHPVDRPIPGKPYTFGQLIDAQAAGDLAVLRAHDLPVLRIHLGSDPDAGLAALERALAAALTGGLSHAHRVHRPRPDGGQHGPPAPPRRARGRRLQPDRREDHARSPARAPCRPSASRSSSPSSTKPRAVWIMVPAGDATEAQIDELMDHLEPGDTIIDGGNTNFHDDVRRHAELRHEGHPLRRRRDVGRDLGPANRLLPDGRRRAPRPSVRSSRSSARSPRRTATCTSAGPARATT